jgi:hypothetical protein
MGVRWLSMKCGYPLIFAMLLIGCVESVPDLPPAQYTDRLVDCTAELLSNWSKLGPRFDYQAATVTADEQQELLGIATDWSIENDYLPCHYQMCAVLLESVSEQVSVWIRPQWDIEGWIPPSADLEVSMTDGTVVSSHPDHSGCAHRMSLGIKL